MIRVWRSLALSGRIVAGIVLIVLLIVVFLFVRSLFVGGLETEAELSRNQADAAIASGQDAANTTGEVAEQAEETDRKVEDANEEIDRASGADGILDAFNDGLCELSPDYCE